MDAHHETQRQSARLLLAAADLAVLDSPQALYAHLNRVLVPDCADWFKLYVRQGTALGLATATHANPELTPVVYERYNLYPLQPSSLTGVAAVMRSEAFELIPEIPETLLPSLCHDQAHLELTRKLGLGSALTLPLRGKNQVIGAVYLAYGGSGRGYSKDDITPVQEFFARVGMTLERLWALEEARRREAKLRLEARQSRAQALRYSRLFEQSERPVLVWSHDGRFLDANAAYERFTGVNPQNFAGYNLFEDRQVINTDHYERLERCLQGLSEVSPPFVYDPRPLNPDGRPYIARVISTPVRGLSGRVREFTTTLQVVLDPGEKMEAFHLLEALNKGQTPVDVLELKRLLLDDFSSHLSPREASVLRLVADGYTNKRIAKVLSISDHTVKFYISSLFNKLEANTRAKMVANAIRDGIL